MALSLFASRVLRLVERVPMGHVTTYGDLARMAGRPGAARAVGALMRAAERPGLPYHRVVAAGGLLGGYGRHPQVKAGLLISEGLVVRRGRVVGFARCRWTGAPNRPARQRSGPASRLTP